MADYRELFRTTESQNWFKCALALQITREGIVDFVENEIVQFHQDVIGNVQRALGLPAGSTCSSCITQNVVPCPSKGLCKIGKAGKCLNFHTRSPTGCTNKICDRIVKGVELEHKYAGPSWKNADAKKWCTSAWEFAKCFCPPDGYTKTSSAKDTDFNGLISIIQNCSRFKKLLSPTSDMVLEKAREVGRSVRHCANLKIDTAMTTSNIDALIDLLNDGQCIRFLPEAINGRLNLDKLKNDTLSISSDDVHKILKRASEETLQELWTNVNDLRKTISVQKLETLREMEIQIAVQNRMFSSLESRVSRIEETTHSISEDRYKTLKAALQTDLVQYYKDEKGTMVLSALCPDLDEKLKEFYVQPKMTVVKVSKHKVTNSKDFKGKGVLTYKDVFEIGNLKNLYIQGNPGMGKSTYSTKMTLDWCDYISDTYNKQEDLSGLNFDFLFLISLREGSNKACEVKQIVKDAVISHLSNMQQYDYTDRFLAMVLDNERCLIILDGLDEWTHPNNGSCKKTAKQIPHRSSGGKCVYLTLTRPWKLSQICLKDSEIDVLFEISGVKEPEELITKVIRSLNISEEETRDAKSFVSATKFMSDLTTIPIIAVQLVCLWHEHGNIPQSQCSIYCAMVKMMLERKRVFQLSSKESKLHKMPTCFLQYNWFEIEKNVLECLGKLAFETLFPDDGSASHVVFTDDFVSRHLEDQMKMASLSAGLLTEYKVHSLNRKCSQVSFLHKTFQEFLATFYLSLNADAREACINRVKIQLEGENVADISQLFIFLCGLEPKLAESVCYILMTTATKMMQANLIQDSKEFHVYWTGHNVKSTVANIMNIVNNGYAECVQNGHIDVNLEMVHICYSTDLLKNVLYPDEMLLKQNVEKMKTIWLEDEDFYPKVLSILKLSAEAIETLCLPYVDESVELDACTSLRALITYNKHNRPVYLDMSKCNNLKFLISQQRNLTVNINTDWLHSCVLWYYDLSKGNIVEALTKRNSNLRHLTLAFCNFVSNSRGESCRLHLDLTPCHTLERLWINSCDIDVSTNTKNLQKCYLENIVLTYGNLLESLKSSTELKVLAMWDCRFSEKDQRHNEDVCLDLSASTNLSEIRVEDSDVVVRYKSHVIGRDQTWWKKTYDLSC